MNIILDENKLHLLQFRLFIFIRFPFVLYFLPIIQMSKDYSIHGNYENIVNLFIEKLFMIKSNIP